VSLNSETELLVLSLDESPNRIATGRQEAEPRAFLMLTPKQNKTIRHLIEADYNSPEEIVLWCEDKLKQPQRKTKIHRPGRKYSLKYYKEIILFLKTSQVHGLGTQPEPVNSPHPAIESECR
jgi:hypothetical protein